MGRRQFVSLAFLLFCGSLSAAPRLGVSLSGGGARGMAHIGVLRVLEENHIPIAAITGTSIGAFVGGLYASGYSLDQIETIFRTTDWDDIVFNDRIARRDLPLRKKIDHERYLFDFEIGFQKGGFRLPPALVYGQKLSLLMDSLFIPQYRQRDFSKLPIPFKTVGSDIETGKMVILESGNLADSIRASMAYPGLFSPVEVDGKLLLDGGNVNNLPVDLVRKMNVDLVLAVDVSAPLNDRERLTSFVDISDQFITMMMRRTTEAQLEKADIKIIPKINAHETFTFENPTGLIQMGTDAMKEQISRLKKFSISSDAYQKWKSRREQLPEGPQTIDKVESLGFKRVDTRTIESRVQLKPGSQFDLKRLNADLTKVYSMGDFERADFEVLEERAQTVLRLRAIEKRWGPNYVHFGVSWDGEIKGKQDGNAIINIQATRLNVLNAEWNTDLSIGTVLEIDTEYYQPLDYRGLFFVAPIFNAHRSDQDFYLDTKRVAEYEVDSVVAGLDGGLALGSLAELRTGIHRGFLNSEVEVGVAAIPSFEVTTGTWVSRFQLDTLDDFYFPRNGFYLSADYVSTYEVLGADERYKKLSFQTAGFATFMRFTPFIQFSGGGNLGTKIPDYDLFMLGGLKSLGGYRDEELRGQNYGVIRSGVMFRLPIPKNYFWDRTFIAAWYEGGNIFQAKRDISLKHLKHAGTAALALETKLGALFLAYGQSGEENKQFYVSVGRPFGIKRSRVY